jgi:hypothetical protein
VSTESNHYFSRQLDAIGFLREGIMGDLENVLPDEMKQNATVCGSELVLPFSEALGAIALATQFRIAVLGLESFKIQASGLQTISYSGYDDDFPSQGDWTAYVNAMNSEAERWIRANPLDRDHGYILTTTSEREFAKLRSRMD